MLHGPVNKNRKIILVALYFLIWGEAANVRFLPECLCYIFHNMAKELDGVLDSSEAEPAKSCTSDGSTSYLENIIMPIYETMAVGLLALGIIAGIALLIVFTRFTIADLFASAVAFIATGWCVLCLALTWKRLVKAHGLWDLIRKAAQMYDAGMGAIIFASIAFLSWFPFVSTFQS